MEEERKNGGMERKHPQCRSAENYCLAYMQYGVCTCEECEYLER